MKKSKVRLVEFIVTTTESVQHPILYIILFPAEDAALAKEYWQHTGSGISSRFAQFCLVQLALLFPKLPEEQMSSTGRKPSFKMISKLQDQQRDENSDLREVEEFVEERFGRNLDPRLVTECKVALRRRIAGVLDDPESEDVPVKLRVDGISEEQVFLFPSGMASIFYSFQLIRTLKPGLKTVQFGFPYIDTLKIQQKFGIGCIFYGNGDQSDLDEFELLLETTKIAAVYCEFPSNPLLKSPPVEELWKLAQKHDFYLIIDETIGNFVNINVLGSCHMIVSSLTKVFSGDSNVMGGSLVINPNINLELMNEIKNSYQDVLFCQDVVFLERNSRTFKSRIHRINNNTEALCDYLISHPKGTSRWITLVSQLFYPKFTTPDRYKKFGSGFGGLFSVVLKTEEDAIRFFDNLDVLKGPSLGTNFTLASPYTLLAHYFELDWAMTYGVSPWLVRVSVGLEDPDFLLDIFRKALI